MGKYIEIEEKNSVLFLRIKDAEIGPDQAEELQEISRLWREKTIRAAILDFSPVDYMSSIFLSAIIETMKAFRAKKINFALTGLNGQLLSILSATKLDRILTIFSSSEEAYSNLTS